MEHEGHTGFVFFPRAFARCLEQLVHLAPDEMPDDYVFTSVDLSGEPEAADYHGALLDVDSTRRYGHQWATDRRSLAILVPSVIIPIEFNLLLNPLHPKFAAVDWGAPQSFEFDPRLLNKSAKTD